jgi:hypothetical protein
LKITRLVLKILKEGRGLKFDVQLIWVSRDNPFLQKADCLLKGIDSDNWELTESDDAHLNVRFGPFSIDLFATSANAKCERFYLRSFEDRTLGVDSFAQNWAGECAYAAPSVSFVMRTIQKAAMSNMSGVLLVPLWKEGLRRGSDRVVGATLQDCKEDLEQQMTLPVSATNGHSVNQGQHDRFCHGSRGINWIHMKSWILASTSSSGKSATPMWSQGTKSLRAMIN